VVAVMSIPRAGAAAKVVAAGLLLLVLAGCGGWRPANAGHAEAPASASPSAVSPSDEPDEAGTPVAALQQLYAVVDQLDLDSAVPIRRLDTVAVGPARQSLATAVRHRRATGSPADDRSTQLTQIVVRPGVRNGETVSTVVQFCASRQIDAESDSDRHRLQPTTITFRYQTGRWRAYTFGFDAADCGCSQPIQCG